MAGKSTCEILRAQEGVSEIRRDFVCNAEDLHLAVLTQPEALIMLVGGVLMIMLLVQMLTRPRGKSGVKESAAGSSATSSLDATKTEKRGHSS